MNNDIRPGDSDSPEGVHTPPASAPLPDPVPLNAPKPRPTVVNPEALPTAAMPTEDEDGPSGWRDLFSTIGILLTALAVALLMIAFVFRSYQVDGPSMQSTLQNQDKLIIWKVPRTWARLTHHAYLPKRGDIIVFSESGLSQFGQDDTKQLIKRVIGLPGDRVVVQNGAITIYNKQHPDGFQPDKSLAYGKNIPVTSGDIDITLRANQLFVCGDNRPDSLDSRAFGPINADQVIGKLVLRVFPINAAEAF